MLVVGVLLALAAPAPHFEPVSAARLLAQDQELVEISRRLADIDLAYDYIDNRYTGVNPYPWEQFPHKPTLRDRKRALRAARESIAASMVEEWDSE